MELTTTSESGLKKKVVLFEPVLTEDQVNVSITEPNDKEKLLADHEKRFFEYITMPNWREVVLVSKGEYPEVDPRNLELISTTSYHLQAIRKGHQIDICPIGIGGLVLTIDNKFPFGIRGGTLGAGKATQMPLGALSNFQPGRNPIFATYDVEKEEELGIVGESNTLFLGWQTDPELTKGENFVMCEKTSWDSGEIRDLHERAYAVYRGAKGSGASKPQAKEKVREAGFLNVAAWEHDKVIFVDNDLGLIDRIIETREIVSSEGTFPVFEVARGALMLYREYCKRK